MGKKVLLNSLSRNDTRLPIIELDWQRIIIIELETYFQSPTSHYHRLAIGHGDIARGILVCTK